MKNVLITGAAGGIGSAIAKRFIAEGFKVFSIDLETIDLGESFVNLKGDVTSLSSLQAIKKQYAGIEFSHIITLAGRAVEDEWKPLEDIDAKSINDSISLNLVGQLNVIKMFLDQLKDEKSSIILMSSINAYGGFGLPYYSAAKLGLVGFMNASKDELAKKHIRINVIAPGTVVTDATEKEPKDFDELLKYTDHHRFVTKEEVADLAYTLCENSQETGVVAIIDEGQLKNKKA